MWRVSYGTHQGYCSYKFVVASICVQIPEACQAGSTGSLTKGSDMGETMTWMNYILPGQENGRYCLWKCCAVCILSSETSQKSSKRQTLTGNRSGSFSSSSWTPSECVWLDVLWSDTASSQRSNRMSGADTGRTIKTARHIEPYWQWLVAMMVKIIKQE